MVGCAHLDQKTSSFERALEHKGARVLWVGAHPDDESLAGALLARACVGENRPCYFLVMTHGEGGECLLRDGCRPDLGTLRGEEMKLAAGAYGAQLEHHRFFNAPLPTESFPSIEELAKRWRAKGDPVGLVAGAIDRFKPTIVLTFDPEGGFTGHPEHKLTARFTLEAIKRAKHRVDAVYFFLNHYWPYRMTGAADPSEPTDIVDAHISCGSKPCLDLAHQASRAHRSQRADMALLRWTRPLWGWSYLRRYEAPAGL